MTIIVKLDGQPIWPGLPFPHDTSNLLGLVQAVKDEIISIQFGRQQTD